MRFSFAIPLLLSAAQLFSNSSPTTQQFQQRLSALEKQVKNQTLYNASARPEVGKGCHLFLTGDLLYWKAEENGLTYAFEVKDPTLNEIRGATHLKDPSFCWDVGFRVGLGFNLPRDGWDLYFNWTRFYTGANSHSHPSAANGLFPVWTLPSGPFGSQFATEAKAYWKLFLNIVDIELGKAYYVGKKFSLRPHLDIRTAFINQTYTVHYWQGSLSDRVRLKDNDWGVGPRVGVDLEWELFGGFSLYGDAAFSLIFGRNALHQKEESNAAPPNDIHFRQSMHETRAILDIGLYLGWDWMFFRDQLHVGIKGGWEEHLFFEQNQFFRFVDPVNRGSIVSNQGNLMMQGWTFSARVDF